MSRWSDVGIDIDFDPREPPWRRWVVVEVTTGEIVSEAPMNIEDACAVADSITATLRADMAKVPEPLSADDFEEFYLQEIGGREP